MEGALRILVIKLKRKWSMYNGMTSLASKKDKCGIVQLRIVPGTMSRCWMHWCTDGSMAIGLAEECIGATEDNDKRVAGWFYFLYQTFCII